MKVHVAFLGISSGERWRPPIPISPTAPYSRAADGGGILKRTRQQRQHEEPLGLLVEVSERGFNRGESGLPLWPRRGQWRGLQALPPWAPRYSTSCAARHPSWRKCPCCL